MTLNVGTFNISVRLFIRANLTTSPNFLCFSKNALFLTERVWSIYYFKSYSSTAIIF